MNCKVCKNPGCAQRGIDFKKQRCDGFIAITNADRVRSMSDEELAEFIVRCVEADFFRVNVLGTHSNSAEEWLDWLRQEVDNG